MYYIENELKLARNTHETVTKSFHIITKYSIDYANRFVTAELASYTNRDSWMSGEAGFVSFIEIQGLPSFSVDPVVFILRFLITNPNSVFYKSNVQRDYNLSEYPEIQRNY